MSSRMRNVVCAFVFAAASAASASAQTTASGTTTLRGPSSPIRPYVVMTAQSVADVERKLHPQANKGAEPIGGEGMELRVAVQHENNLAPASAEIHDASDDVYYVLEGTATLTLGGTLESPREVEPGEWRGPGIKGGKSFTDAAKELGLSVKAEPAFTGQAYQQTPPGEFGMAVRTAASKSP